MKCKKMLALSLAALSAVFLMTGCSASSSSTTGTSEQESSAETSADGSEADSTMSGESGEAGSSSAVSTGKDASSLKIGVMLSGSANDGGWSQMGAEAAEAAARTYGCETNFSESIASTDFESVMRGYADAGYDIIVSHGAEFLDTAKTVAADYPDTFFICTSAQSGQEPNVAAVDFATYRVGFLDGAACAMASKTGKIGAVGAMEIDSITSWVEGVKAGAAYIDPEAEVITTYTGTFDDPLKAKQCVKALEEKGVDVVTQNADACGAGSVQQCDEDGIINVGAVSDETKDGDSCFMSVLQDAKLGIELAIDKAIEGELPAGANVFGADVGVISVVYKDGQSIFTDEQIKKMDELLELSKTNDMTALS